MIHLEKFIVGADVSLWFVFMPKIEYNYIRISQNACKENEGE